MGGATRPSPVSSPLATRSGREELYDLRKDPAQIDNVAGRAEYRMTAAAPGLN